MLSTMMLAYPKNVTINADSRPAEKVFAEIVVQSGHNYIYSPDLLKGLKVTVHAKNEPLESVLKRMFSGTGIAFTIKGNNVVLKKEKKAKGKESEARRHSVSGFVKEEESGEPIAGAIVRDRRTGKARMTHPCPSERAKERWWPKITPFTQLCRSCNLFNAVSRQLCRCGG